MRLPETHILENGDHLSRQEFEALCVSQGIERAELIDGVVRMAAAVRFRQHGDPHARIMLWLGTYAAEIDGVCVADNTSIRIDDKNEPQPDALMIRQHGQTRIGDDGFLEGPPELIVEIAASSVSLDAHEKRDLYERSGVLEYVLWKTEEDAVDWFTLIDGKYMPHQPDQLGIVRSNVFDRLCLDVASLLAGNMRQVLEILREELDS